MLNIPDSPFGSVHHSARAFSCTCSYRPAFRVLPSHTTGVTVSCIRQHVISLLWRLALMLLWHQKFRDQERGNIKFDTASPSPPHGCWVAAYLVAFGS